MTKRASILVTGSSGGIGAKLTERLIEDGFHVIGLDLVVPSVKPDAHFDFVACNLSDFVNHEPTLGSVREALEGLDSFARLCGLVNNAAFQYVGPVVDMPLSDFRKTLDVNLTAAFELSRICYKPLAANQGSVVNISSIHARLSKRHFVAYATSKAALSALTRYMALEWGARVRVNAIEPAAVETQMLTDGFGEKWPEAAKQLGNIHPSGKISTPAEIATFVQLLLNSNDKHFTGLTLSVDGGLSSVLTDVSK